MRDFETMVTALPAAETGRLVFSTLHTNDVRRRFSAFWIHFPPASAADSPAAFPGLLAVVAQQLVPGLDGACYPAVEILIATSGVRRLMRKGDDLSFTPRFSRAAIMA
jgi:twitching motility protein PilT